MMPRPLAVPVPPEATEAVAQIVAKDAEFREAIRAMNRHERPTGVMAEAIFALADERTAMETQLRRTFFPRAHRVTVDPWGVYTWSPTGRSIRQVWKLTP